MPADMIRRAQRLDEQSCRGILEKCTSGVLALSGTDGYPYALPLSYAPCGDAIYFHCAVKGYKLDCIRGDARVSFCVVERDEVAPERFTTVYRSVIVYGRMSIVTDADEIRRAAVLLAERYCPLETEESIDAAIESAWSRLAVLRLDIEHITGKQAAELIGKRDN